MNPKITLARTIKLVDQNLIIKVTGLKPNQQVKITAEMEDDMNRTWSSSGVFIADQKGNIDLNKTASKKGTYTGCHPNGLLWSMQLKNENNSLPPMFIKNGIQPHKVIFKLFLEGKITDEKELQINFISSNIKRTNIKEPVIGQLFNPENKNNLPAVIVVGGSTGGFFWTEQLAALLSTNGYAALALNYFDHRNDNLPNELLEIKLEYFKKAFDWLKQQPQIDKNNISMMGISKGSELSLLFGSYFPDSLKSIVSYVPSSHVFEGISMGGHKNKSSWTYNNKPIDFIKYPQDTNFSKEKAPSNLREIHDRALNEANLKQLNNARIPVENIKCPILMISGDKDTTWDSGKMCRDITKTLKNNKNSSQSKHIHFKNMGHTFFLPNIPPIIDNPTVTVENAANANKESWEEVLKFLNKHSRI